MATRLNRMWPTTLPSTSATIETSTKPRCRQRTSEQADLIGAEFANNRHEDTYAEKARELRDEETELQREIERCSRGRNEIIDIAVKAFELSQSLRAKWVAASFAAKRRILEIVCLNCSLDRVSLVTTMRKPFDLYETARFIAVSSSDDPAISQSYSLFRRFCQCDVDVTGAANGWLRTRVGRSHRSRLVRWRSACKSDPLRRGYSGETVCRKVQEHFTSDDHTTAATLCCRRFTSSNVMALSSLVSSRIRLSR
jgi:hypothetical protein